jgi:hypothetical protein
LPVEQVSIGHKETGYIGQVVSGPVAFYVRFRCAEAALEQDIRIELRVMNGQGSDNGVLSLQVTELVELSATRPVKASEIVLLFFL